MKPFRRQEAAGPPARTSTQTPAQAPAPKPAPADVDALLRAACDAVAALPGWRDRDGQRDMMAAVAGTLRQGRLDAELRDEAGGDKAAGQRLRELTPAPIAVVEGGTGVGKTLGYLVPGIVQARARGTRLVVSTATVALQEQLIHRDLPALAALLPGGATFALLKGRGRFACNLKLEDVAVHGVQSSLLEDWDAPVRAATPAELAQQRVGVFAKLADALAAGQWSGERDTLEMELGEREWGAIAADRHSCTGRRCPRFSQCGYYGMRRAIQGVDVLVVNHDLVLSSLAHGAATVPGPGDALWVFDEAHHLPARALDQFSSRLELAGLPRALRGTLGAIERATAFLDKRGAATTLQPAVDVARESAAALDRMLHEAMAAVGEVTGTRTGTGANGGGGGAPAARPSGAFARADAPRVMRFAQGRLPEALMVEIIRLQRSAGSVHAAGVDAVAQLREAMDGSKDPEAVARLATDLGAQLARLDGVERLLSDLLDDAAPPRAKWVETSARGLVLRAAPVSAAALLRGFVWESAAACVLTSATLRSLGGFDWFLREAGLAHRQGVTTLAVPSPFDYAAQGTFVVHETEADPGDARGHASELAHRAVPAALAGAGRGALVLCTSRDQMETILAALPAALRADCLVQGEAPRAALLSRHRERVEAGQRSVIVGLQSFGEGLDLPGALCETVLIAKIPFAPPDGPIEQAKAEWLESQGRNAFSEMSVPAAGLKLTQWAGRGIRSETDSARIVVFDRRLVTKSYGKGLLRGLPPFRLVRRGPAGLEREIGLG